MDWSADGKLTGTHAARKAEPGHGTVVPTAVLGLGTRAVGLVQGAARSGGRGRPREALLGLTRGGI